MPATKGYTYASTCLAGCGRGDTGGVTRHSRPIVCPCCMLRHPSYYLLPCCALPAREARTVGGAECVPPLFPTRASLAVHAVSVSSGYVLSS